MWRCTEEPCLATCALYGDGHFLTFDGQRYTFSGDCQYTLVQVGGLPPLSIATPSPVGQLPWGLQAHPSPALTASSPQDHCGGNGSAKDAFRVVTENVPCGTTGTTCSKDIKIFLGVSEGHSWVGHSGGSMVAQST